ncbi:hypothetical protein VTN77DRAFT_8024 [Rasamsonia byssochlamydoides]|uniref:uncharacterized protein n=1 Tax=Rasamsonia byssochlamydoides TaxID=89139 RepID=UPI003743CE49
MVYCGKPSAGCGTCRARKVKCDLARPACFRCRKANRTCPGYRDQLSLWFRDESQSVVQKAKAAVPGSRQTGSNAGNPGTMIAKTAVRSDKAPNLQKPVDHSLPASPFAVDPKFQATCFFFSTYSWLNTSCLSKHDADCALVPTAPLGERALMASIASVGMANLASLQNSPSLRLSARREYVAALKLTNAALCDPVQAKEDTTLTAIICLSLFEIITCERPESINSWVEHANGAMALLELRGAGQLSRECGLQMFNALRNEILIGCMQRRTNIPPSLIELSKQVAAAASQMSPVAVCADRLTQVIAKLCNLRVDIHNQVIVDSAEILSIAFAIDSELEAFVSDLPPNFSYTIGTRIDGRPFRVSEHYDLSPYNGYFHIYESLWMCNIWNNYRSSRILVNELILAGLRSLAARAVPVSKSSVFRDQCRSIRDLVRQLAADICCTVPYLFGVVDSEKEEVQNASIIKSTAGGFTLLFPLYVAASVDGYLSPTYTWVVNCFTIIARAVGIDTALTLISMLPREPGIVNWIDRMDCEELQGRSLINVELSDGIMV